jgi:glutaminyl-tRNA synthetase
MGVLRPLKVVLENYPETQTEELEAVNNPEDPEMGNRKIPFSKTLFIEQDDFMEDPPKDFYRLAPGREVRLRYAYFIKCTDVVKKEGKPIELHCTYDPATKGGYAPDGRKVKSTIHWVSASHALSAEVRLYDRLFTVVDPAGQKNADFKEFLNPRSLEVLHGCKVEPSLITLTPFDRFQFERLGYFCVDPETKKDGLVLNRTVELRDTWAKLQKATQKK